MASNVLFSKTIVLLFCACEEIVICICVFHGLKLI